MIDKTPFTPAFDRSKLVRQVLYVKHPSGPGSVTQSLKVDGFIPILQMREEYTCLVVKR